MTSRVAPSRTPGINLRAFAVPWARVVYHYAAGGFESAFELPLSAGHPMNQHNGLRIGLIDDVQQAAAVGMGT
ncbi:hypothetical protein A5722_32340 [Mycobacterium vulneris]|nr:hypothetical protein A5722_32340 [Mycolicibacterium vulneris]OCB67824.1 hypothetical protein A5729_06770 [Mycolicibacterium vulneris]